jgi:hypothetical protein
MMDDRSNIERLDRHALVMAIWPAFGLIAAALVSYGFRADRAEFILAGFLAVIGGFISHVIVNAALGTGFTRKELGLGLVLYAAALLLFGLGTLFSPEIRGHFLMVSLGFVGTFIAAVFYLITHFGVRQAFTAFDTIRDFHHLHDDKTGENGA